MMYPGTFGGASDGRTRVGKAIPKLGTGAGVGRILLEMGTKTRSIAYNFNSHGPGGPYNTRDRRRPSAQWIEPSEFNPSGERDA